MEQNIQQSTQETMPEVKPPRGLKDKIFSFISWVVYLFFALFVLAMTVPMGAGFLLIVFMVLVSAPLFLHYARDKSEKFEASGGSSIPRRILNFIILFFVVLFLFWFGLGLVANLFMHKKNNNNSAPVAAPSLNNL